MIDDFKVKLLEALGIEIEAWMAVHEEKQRTFSTDEFMEHMKNFINNFKV